MISRRFLLWQLLLLAGCTARRTAISKLTIGVVAYDQGARSIEQYQGFKDYLAQQMNAIIELEPVYNELQALAQIRQRHWSIVFSPPGLAAIAINKEQYIPIFRTLNNGNQRSVLVVRRDSPLQTLKDLTGKVVALGEVGSAAGYYLPLYDLYGLSLAEVKIAPTPKTVLQWVDNGDVATGALSKDEYDRYRRELGLSQLRILHTSSKKSPPGVVLLGPTVERNQQEAITKVMTQAGVNVTADAGYIPNAKVPDYQEFIKIVEKVQPIAARIPEKPALLTL